MRHISSTFQPERCDYINIYIAIVWFIKIEIFQKILLSGFLLHILSDTYESNLKISIINNI